MKRVRLSIIVSAFILLAMPIAGCFYSDNPSSTAPAILQTDPDLVGHITQLERVEKPLLHGLVDGLVLAEQPAFLAVETHAAAHAPPRFLDHLLGRQPLVDFLLRL